MDDPNEVLCPLCQGSIHPEAKKCRHCGEWLARPCEICGTPIRGEWAARGTCAQCEEDRRNVVSAGALYPSERSAYAVGKPLKSRGVATVLALLLGGFGVHKFYLGKVGAGVAYLLFFWTLIPAIIALVEGISYAMMDDVEFHRRFPGF